jgi:hypothetical protein
LSYQVGDLLFSRNGLPGLVTGRDRDRQTLLVKPRGEEFEKARKFGYVNGMSPEQRQDYRVIIAESRERKEPAKRVDFLQEKIKEIENDPKKNVLQRYLESEMAHIINSQGVKLPYYEVKNDKLY